MSKTSTATRNNKIVDVIVKIFRFIFAPLGERRRNTILSLFSEKVIPVISVSVKDDKKLYFWGFGGWSAYRGASVLEKEPLTIKWIDGFEKDSIFWDIGANIGVYSVYAAVVKNIKTWAFEPSLMNIAVLNKNLELNNIDNLVTALPFALGEKTGLDTLNMTCTNAANTGAQFAHDEPEQKTVFKQACLGFSADDFVKSNSSAMPNYIKMDVDGLEALIIKGASNVLANKNFKSLIMEFDIETEEYTKTKETLESYGLIEEESEPTVRGREHIRNTVFVRKS